MTTMVFHAGSSATFEQDVLGSDKPIQFGFHTPTVCYVEIDEHLSPDNRLLATKGREITIKIQY